MVFYNCVIIVHWYNVNADKDSLDVAQVKAYFAGFLNTTDTRGEVQQRDQINDQEQEMIAQGLHYR